ncbi:hypothetical protein K443DRAFT_113188, partial [Laccaria amethystina LaAM-08-1]
SYFSSIALALSASTRAEAFTFTSSTPSQCQNIVVTWSGRGQPPFRLLIIPPGLAVRTFSIPSSAYQGNYGSFSTPLLFNQNQHLMLSMSDATGATAGGISGLLMVGPPQGASQCNMVLHKICFPGDDFFFSLDSDLQQCQPYPFTLYDEAIQPITIAAFVPLGSSFVLNPPMGSSFSWIANLTAGTSVTSDFPDEGRKGGTSPIKVVGLMNNNSCLAPTVVTSSRSGVTSSRMTSTLGSSQTSKSNSGQGGSKIRTIIGAAAGGFALVGITAFLFFCFSRNGCAKSGYRPNQKVDFIYDLVSPHDVFILPAGYTPALAPQESSHNSALASTPFLSATPAQHASTAIPLASRFGKANSAPQFDNSNAPLQFHDPNAPHRLGTPDLSQQQFSLNAPQRFGAPNVPRLITQISRRPWNCGWNFLHNIRRVGHQYQVYRRQTMLACLPQPCRSGH